MYIEDRVRDVARKKLGENTSKPRDRKRRGDASLPSSARRWVARGVDRTHTGAASDGGGCSSGAADGGGGSGASRSVFTQGEVPLARATRRSRTSSSAPVSAFRVFP